MKIAFTRLINDTTLISFDKRDNWSEITEDNIIIPPHTKDESFNPGDTSSRTSNILTQYGYRFYKFNYLAEKVTDLTGSNADFNINNQQATIDTKKVYDNNFDFEVKNHIGKDIENVSLPDVYLKNIFNFVCQPVSTYDMAKSLKVNFTYETKDTVVKSLKNVGITTHGQLTNETNVSLKLTGLTETSAKTNSFLMPESINDRNTDTSLAYLIEYLNTGFFSGKLVDLTPTYFPETIAIGDHFKGLNSIYGIAFNQKLRNKNVNYTYTVTDDKGKVKSTEIINYSNADKEKIKQSVINKDNYSLDEETMLNCKNFGKFYLAPNIKRVEHGAFYNTNIDTYHVTFGDPDAWEVFGNPYDEDFLLGYKIDVTSPFQYYRELKYIADEQENKTNVYNNIFLAPPSDSEEVRDGIQEIDIEMEIVNGKAVTGCVAWVREKTKEYTGRAFSATTPHKLNHYFNVGINIGALKNCGLTSIISGNGALPSNSEMMDDGDYYDMAFEHPEQVITATDNNNRPCLVDIYNNPVSSASFDCEKRNGDFINICLAGLTNQSIVDDNSYNHQVSRLYVDYVCYKDADTIKSDENENSNSESRLSKVKNLISAKTFQSMYNK